MRRLFKARLPVCMAGAMAAYALVPGPATADEPSEAAAAASAEYLREGFANPPDSARPRVWWHWMNGNVTKDGITKDLEWMKRVGIGGVQNFDAGLGVPQIVDKRLIYMEPDWREAFRHAVQTADSKGMEFAIAASPGWSETGGPWVAPEDGMKKIAWSELILTGGEHFSGALPEFPSTTGQFQTLVLRDRRGEVLPDDEHPGEATGEIAVFAVPVSAAPFTLPAARDVFAGGLDASLLEDDDLESHVTILAGDAQTPGSIELRYAAPITIQSARLFAINAKRKFRGAMYAPQLQARTDAGWEDIGSFALNFVPSTTSFAPVTADTFRIVFHPVPGANALNLGDGVPGADAVGRTPPPPPETIRIGDLRLSGEARIARVEEKVNFVVGSEFYPIWDHAETPGLAFSDVIDLTDNIRADGTLDWTAPAGRDWRVVRMGWSLTGERNHPASPEATGLEVDKFDPAAVRRYLETYLGMYREALGPDLIGARGLQAILTDSIEVGGSNWTGDMLDAFAVRRGYDARPWLPALLGHVMISPDASERFLYDFRQTLTELMTEAHYKTVAEVAHEHGMIVYGEALEGARPALGDDLAMRSFTDVPMAAMWMFNPGEAPRSALIGDIKGAASVATIYGQNIVAAESLTAILAPWAYAPTDIKPVMDFEFVLGVNRPVIHTSVHQPSDAHVPGLSLGSVGQYFNRHESWAEMARPWVDYMARSSFLLQQGHGYSDIAYFYGEETPITQQFAAGVPEDAPVQFGYDFVNADILKQRLTVDDGLLTLRAPGTGTYRALYLGGTSERMTLATLQRIAELAEAGALIIGEKPASSPKLTDDHAAFSALADRLWAGGAVTMIGKGRIMRGTNPEAALLASGTPADFTYSKSADTSQILFRHRQLDDGDIYFLTNRALHPEATQARFRITGKKPELWNAVTQTVTPLSYRTEGEHTVVPLNLAAQEAVFVVFRETTDMAQATIAAPVMQTIATLDAAWEVTFQEGRGAPAGMAMPQLVPLNNNDDPGIRYFSGLSTYSSAFTLPAGHRPGAPLWLDLGEIGDLAEVRINGEAAGITWLAPYRLDIADLVREGRNIIEVKVANRWVNRLIGDKQPGAEKIAFVAAPTYNADAPLRPAGLIGPVTLITTTNGAIAKGFAQAPDGLEGL